MDKVSAVEGGVGWLVWSWSRSGNGGGLDVKILRKCGLKVLGLESINLRGQTRRVDRRTDGTEDVIRPTTYTWTDDPSWS
jgi:hypothetical protein